MIRLYYSKGRLGGDLDYSTSTASWGSGFCAELGNYHMHKQWALVQNREKARNCKAQAQAPVWLCWYSQAQSKATTWLRTGMVQSNHTLASL